MCVFCKIVDGSIPSYKVYEDDDVLAFLDLSQINIGHTLVIPKKHYENIFDLDEEISNKIFSKVCLISNAIRKALYLSGVNIVNNSGDVAGQSVMHFHIHIIPRTNNDGISFVSSKNELSNRSFTELSIKISSLLK